MRHDFPQTAHQRRRKLRFIPLIVGVGVASLVSYFYAPKDVDLLLVLPDSAVSSNATPTSSVEVRVLRSSDGVQIARARKSRAGEGRTVVLPVRIPRGDYRLEAWPAGVDRPERYEARFSFDGDDAIEVTLESATNDNAPRSP